MEGLPEVEQYQISCIAPMSRFPPASKVIFLSSQHHSVMGNIHFCALSNTAFISFIRGAIEKDENRPMLPNVDEKLAAAN